MFQGDSEAIARTAGRLQGLLVLILIGTVAIEGWALWTELLAIPRLPTQLPAGAPTSNWSGWWCDLLSGVAVILGLLCLVRMAGALAQTGRMVPRATSSLRSFAYCILAAAASTSILPVAVLFAARALHLSDGSGAAVVGSDFLLLLIAGVLVPITHLLASANLAREELDRIV
ncbi:hypothetical protein SAMIE_1004530 [Sphingobium amiense]|uniref:DUF2975 domain-containing protein n=1 Tax=Sphingobium amiense TaxID=135719 RepID=A0A494W984_9SPHN|nr:DUF2975 domain-containing protein [Sphingobium amiense]BBD96952.1 hypothetical protein SAMIE_1004530 [Sphingobium amiense]